MGVGCIPGKSEPLLLSRGSLGCPNGGPSLFGGDAELLKLRFSGGNLLSCDEVINLLLLTLELLLELELLLFKNASHVVHLHLELFILLLQLGLKLNIGCLGCLQLLLECSLSCFQ